MIQNSIRKRQAFTLMEATAALAVILLVGVIVAQSLVWSLRERAHAAAHCAALELATNVLETARAESFDKLGPAWAAAQTIPSDVEKLLPEGKLAVTLEPGPSPSLTKRVSVEVRWQSEPGPVTRSVRLTTVLGPRELKKGEGKP